MKVMSNTREEKDSSDDSKKKQNNFSHLRSSSLSSLLSFSRQSDLPVLSSVSRKNEQPKPKTSLELLITPKTDFVKEKKSVGEEVIITLIDANNLNFGTEDTTIHGIYCKFDLDTQQYKSKCASRPCQPEWNEKFKFDFNRDSLLEISLWDKGKETQPLAKCSIDLSTLETERTHDLWQEFDETRGQLHLSVTISTVIESILNDDIQEEITQWISNWGTVGELRVSVLEARGLPITDLNGKISAYCALELENERKHTTKVSAYNTLQWNNAEFTFNILDMTSALTVKVYTKTLMNTFKDELLGKVSIPLLRIDDAPRWYALKDRSLRNHAKGQCPRVLLKMSITWDAVKASMRLFRPIELKLTKKPPKFDLALVYRNMEFIRDTFNVLYELNEEIKVFLEWEDKGKCRLALVAYLIVCVFFKLWMLPLLGLLPFLYQCYRSYKNELDDAKNYKITFEENNNVRFEYIKPAKTTKSFSGKLYDLQDVTFTITNGIDYMASITDRLHNLTKFSIPMLPQLTILLLIVAAFGLYYIPVNYLLASLGIYKFARKQINPNRKLNNDVLDFISHMPDKGTLRDWKELDVPEYGQTEVTNDRISFTITMDDIQQERSKRDERKSQAIQMIKKLQDEKANQIQTGSSDVQNLPISRTSQHQKSD